MPDDLVNEVRRQGVPLKPQHRLERSTKAMKRHVETSSSVSGLLECGGHHVTVKRSNDRSVRPGSLASRRRCLSWRQPIVEQPCTARPPCVLNPVTKPDFCQRIQNRNSPRLSGLGCVGRNRDRKSTRLNSSH